MTDQPQTLGDVLGPGVTKDDLADTERVLQRFEAVAMDEFDGEEEWLTTAHKAVCRALEYYDNPVQTKPESYSPMRCSGCGGPEFHIPMTGDVVCCATCGRITGAVGPKRLKHRGENIKDLRDQ